MIRIRPAFRFRATLALVLGGGLLGLAGCSNGVFGMNRSSPDEYTVTTQAPLSIPSRFTLPPPRPDAPRPQDKPTDLAAEAALDPAVELMTGTAPTTPGQQALVRLAGPPPDPNIREYLDDHLKQLNQQGGIGSSLAFWAKTPEPGKALNAAKEAANLRRLGIPTLNPPPGP